MGKGSPESRSPESRVGNNKSRVQGKEGQSKKIWRVLWQAIENLRKWKFGKAAG